MALPILDMTAKFKRIFPVLIIAIAAAIGFLYMREPSLAPEEINHARLERLVSANAIAQAEIAPRTPAGMYTIKGKYLKSGKKADFTVTTHLSEPLLEKLLSKSTTTMSMPHLSARSKLVEMLPTLFIAVIIGALLFYQMRATRSTATHKVRQRPSVRFDDVAGVDEAKAEVREVIDFLREPGKYKKLGGSLPKGVLLIGPPGTGKTMLARAIAGEANANFFSASGSDFNEVYVGVGAKRIREIFNQAKAAKPSIIFIDEIDCLGKHRKHDQNGESQQTLNALLTAMDGFNSADGVIVVAATNRPEDLDDALMRPGRFDRKVFVSLPDSRGRRAILNTHSRNAPIEHPEKVLEVIAATTPGMSGADLANLINEAAILSAQRSKANISLAELEEARDKVRFGIERRSMTMKADERRVVAYHEAGHAIAQLEQPLLPPLHKVTIIPRGMSLGSTMSLPKEDQNIHSRTYLLQQLVVLAAGRAAEQTFIGDITNGANGDLDSAKNIARKMIHDWGMGQKLYYEFEKDHAESEINTLLTDAYKQALAIIEQKREQTKLLAETLLKEETLARDQVLKLLGIEDGRASKKPLVIADFLENGPGSPPPSHYTNN